MTNSQIPVIFLEGHWRNFVVPKTLIPPPQQIFCRFWKKNWTEMKLAESTEGTRRSFQNYLLVLLFITFSLKRYLLYRSYLHSSTHIAKTYIYHHLFRTAYYLNILSIFSFTYIFMFLILVKRLGFAPVLSLLKVFFQTPEEFQVVFCWIGNINIYYVNHS